jgi:hypothetical protein
VPEITSYSTNSSPPNSFLFLGVDPTNFSQGSGGTAETVTLETLASSVGGGSVPGMQVIWMDAHGADHTGGTSVTSTFNTLLAAQSGAPCLFVFGVGTYLWSTAPSNLGKDQSVTGLGSRVTTFSWSGSGPLFTVTEAVTGGWNGSDNAGSLSGFSIVGPYGSGSTAGVKYGALQGLRVDDVGFYGLPGGAVTGYAVSTSDWSEEAVFTRLDISECGVTSGYVFGFSGTSFDYTKIDALVVVEANIDILALSLGAEMQGLQLALRGNVHGGVSNTGAVISLDRANASDASLIGGGSFAVSMEGDDTSDGGAGTVGHYLLYMNSTSSVSQFEAQGTFFVYDAGAASQGTYNPNSLPCAFSGITNSSSGTSMADGACHAFLGGTRHTSAMDGFGSIFDSTIYWEFGDVQTALLATGSNGTLTFDGTDGFVIKGTLYLKEPASGTAPTVTLPGTWIGSAPTYASSGRVWKILCDFLPVEATWYLQSAGVS